MTMCQVLCYRYVTGYQLPNKVTHLLRCFYFSSKYLKFGDNELQVEFLFLEDREYLRFFWVSFNTPLSEDISKELSGSDFEHAFC